MSRDRGVRLQNALAAYLRTWWPRAESAGSGRQGRDILHTPGIWWECKTAQNGRPAAFIQQAKEGAETCGDLPVVVYFPPGTGARSTGDAIAMLPLRDLVCLLTEVGHAPPPSAATAPPSPSPSAPPSPASTPTSSSHHIGLIQGE